MSMAAVKYATTSAPQSTRGMPNKNFTASFEAIAVTEVTHQQKEDFHYADMVVHKAEAANNDGPVHHGGLLANLTPDSPSGSADHTTAVASSEPDVNMEDLLAQLAEMGINLNDTQALEDLANTLDTSAAHHGMSFDMHTNHDASAFEHVMNTHVDFSHHMSGSVDAIAAFAHSEATVCTDMDSHLSIGEVIL